MKRLVYVSGAPEAGKTSLAGPLAAALGYALLTKDTIKETLHDALGDPGAPEADLACSRRLGGASMELLWTLAARAPKVVIEANFRPYSDYEHGKLTALAAPLVEVYCRCPLELAAERFAARHADRHPTHVSSEVSLEYLAQFDRPFGLGPVIEVDTRDPVDVAALAEAVLAAFA